MEGGERPGVSGLTHGGEGETDAVFSSPAEPGVDLELFTVLVSDCVPGGGDLSLTDIRD